MQKHPRKTQEFSKCCFPRFTCFCPTFHRSHCLWGHTASPVQRSPPCMSGTRVHVANTPVYAHLPIMQVPHGAPSLSTPVVT